MTFAELFTEQTVLHDLKATTSDECFQEILDALVASNRLAKKEVPRALEVLRRREKLGSTGIGNGVAIPHVKLEGLGDMAVGLGVHRGGLDFRAIDGERVRIVFLVVRSAEDAGEHLRLLQWISRLGRNDDFRRFVAAAKSPAEMIGLLKELGSA